MTANQVAYWKNVETERANRAQENLTAQRNAETERANKASEGLRTGELDLATKRHKTDKALGIANAVTGGIKNVASAFKDILSPVSDATKLVESAGILGLL